MKWEMYRYAKQRAGNAKRPAAASSGMATM